MNINEQELSEAVERLREGDDNGLLVKSEDILRIMQGNNDFVATILHELFLSPGAVNHFENRFKEIARYELREALRTHKEQQAGLM